MSSGTVKRLVVSHVRRRGNGVSLMDGEGAGGRGGRGRETYLRDADELTHVPHALRARLSSLPEEFSEGRGEQRRAAVGTPRFFVLAASSEHLLRAVAVEAARTHGVSDDVRPRAREWQWLKAGSTCLVRRRGARPGTPWLPHLPRPETRFPALGRATLSAPLDRADGLAPSLPRRVLARLG